MNSLNCISGYSSVNKELKQISDALKNRASYDKLDVDVLSNRISEIRQPWLLSR